MTSRCHVHPSRKLSGISYSLRGPLASQAERMRAAGKDVIALNLGDPAVYGLPPARKVVQAVRDHLDHSCGYSSAAGLPDARDAVARHYRSKGLDSVQSGDVYLGNGVSELAPLCLHALLNPRDQVLIPAPDYPMWTASVAMAGGRPVHYRCDEASNWYPDPGDIARKVTDRTRAIVVINPNNPTGAVWPGEILDGIADVARRHDLVLLADEIYADFLYDGTRHTPLATCAPDVPCLTFGGLSKRSRIPGYRMGWLALTGCRGPASDYVTALDTLATLRLCPNVPAQRAVETALHLDDTTALTAPGGALCLRRDHLWRLLAGIPGVRTVKPQGAFYVFPRITAGQYRLGDDERLAADLLHEEGLLVVPGSGLGPVPPGHLRMVTLPQPDVLTEAVNRLARFLERRCISGPSTTNHGTSPKARSHSGKERRPPR
ncbi:aminotransferase class I/II-fold pyridoxal phosphate-dependent enzyme [Streptomyces griseofuscus]|uniref:aminotransferase class I/II-fold pyridoxal phosphate-dependent enzyme n=1 Tax=Streptomyces griseofuscus TaxID=146922 RepID=UPI0037FC4821